VWLNFIHILFISFDFIIYMGQGPLKITQNFYYLRGVMEQF